MFWTQWGPDEWTAFGTIVTAVVAVAAALVGLAQVRLARQLREDKARPFVVVDLQLSPVAVHILTLVIENTGSTLARDVTVSFAPPLSSSIEGYDLSESALLTDGLPTMPPHRRWEFFFDSTLSRFEARPKLPMRYEATVSYSDARGRPQESLRYVLDIGFFYGLRRVETYDTHHVAKALRGIEKRMDGWTGTGQRLDVRSFDGDDESRREQTEYDLTGEWPSLGRKAPPDLLMWLGRLTLVRLGVRHVREWLTDRRERRAG